MMFKNGDIVTPIPGMESLGMGHKLIPGMLYIVERASRHHMYLENYTTGIRPANACSFLLSRFRRVDPKDVSELERIIYFT